MEEDLTVTLAIVRNRLLAAKADERDSCVLKEVAAKVSERGDDSPYRTILVWAIENAMRDLNEGRIAQAAAELDLVHNIPLCWERPSSWDEELFLKGMLVEYIEVASVDRIKSLFALFGKEGARG